MKITEVRIRMVNNNTKLKAIASTTFDDCFVVHDIKIVESDEGDRFISFPSRKATDGTFKDIVHPLDNTTREMIKTTILTRYEEEKSKMQ